MPTSRSVAGAFLLAISLSSAAPVLHGLGSNTSVTCVSADGSVIGGNFPSLGFLWTPAGGIVVLPQPEGASAWKVAALSADGAIAAGHFDVGSVRAPCLWTPGGITTIPLLPGTPFPFIRPQASVAAISDDGTVTAGVSTSSARIQDAFRSQNGTTTATGLLPGGTAKSLALAISADGTTVVGQSSSTQGDQAFLKVGNQPVVGLGDLPGGSFLSVAHDVSADGSVVIGTGAGSSGIAAFRWTAATGMLALQAPAPLVATRALAISADGSIIAGNAGPETTPSAVVWSEATGAAYLTDVLGQHDIDATGWQFRSVNVLSADGSVIAGDGVFQGVAQGWVIRGAAPLFAGPQPPLPDRVDLTIGESGRVIGFDTQPGLVYQVEASADLADPWSAVGAAHSTAGAGGASGHEVLDPAPPGLQRFYRVRVEFAP